MSLNLKNPSLLRQAARVGTCWVKAGTQGIAVTHPATVIQEVWEAIR